MRKNFLTIDFLGIGAMKSATSWIADCLREHPEICQGKKKEMHFFDDPYKYRQGLEYYASFFRDCPRGTLKGEFTPSYLYDPKVPARIHQNFPEVKILACLRNPIWRAFSHYRYGRERGGRLSIYKNFREALKKDPELKDRGFYHEQLKRYYDLFPSQNILVIIYDDLKKNPKETIKGIYEFLGVNTNFIPPSLDIRKLATGFRTTRDRLPFINKAFYRSKTLLDKNPLLYKALSPLLSRTRLRYRFKKYLNKNKKVEKLERPTQENIKKKDFEYLLKTYKNDIENLQELLGKDLSNWFKYE
jgi:hypothetical protein